MFHSARVKLTIWYIVISMAVSIFFSGGIYFILHRELERGERRMQFRLNVMRQIHPEIDPNLVPRRPTVASTEKSITENLLYINLIILLISSLAGYFLAGRTLRPISEMVDQQNQFVADASHELRTPLTSLKTGIEVNLRDRKLDLKQARTVLKENLDDVNKLHQLSENLLALATLRSISASSKDILDLSEILKKAVQAVSYQAKGKNIDIHTDFENVYVMGDNKRLTDLFVIFLENAVKYSSGGTTISLSSTRTDGHVDIRVKDQGIGIEKKDLQYIFDRFFRADTSRSKSRANGYGLGLAIAHEIVVLHGGTIHVESTVGRGTVFIVTLPIVRKK